MLLAGSAFGGGETGRGSEGEMRGQATSRKKHKKNEATKK